MAKHSKRTTVNMMIVRLLGRIITRLSLWQAHFIVKK